jgi:single-stranded-DNA-specific exonuclease
VADFRAFVCEQVRTQLAGASPDNTLDIDAILSARGVQPRLARQIQEQIGPFGATNPEPVFVLPAVRVRTADIVGQNHVRLQISDAEGGASVKAMGFRMADTEIGNRLLSRNCGPVHLAGHLKHDTWNGRERAEIHIRDVAPVS